MKRKGSFLPWQRNGTRKPSHRTTGIQDRKGRIEITSYFFYSYCHGVCERGYGSLKIIYRPYFEKKKSIFHYSTGGGWFLPFLHLDLLIAPKRMGLFKSLKIYLSN